MARFSRAYGTGLVTGLGPRPWSGGLLSEVPAGPVWGCRI